MNELSTDLSHSRTDRHKHRLARWGEDTAADYLKTKGYAIIAQNVWFPVGELDIIAHNPAGEIVFVEVKTRSNNDFGAAEAVSNFKLHKLRRAATTWLQGRPYSPVRFDVISIVLNSADSTKATLSWHKGVDDGAC